MKPHYIYRSFTRCDPGPWNPPGTRYFSRVFSTGGYFMVWHTERSSTLLDKPAKVGRVA